MDNLLRYNKLLEEIKELDKLDLILDEFYYNSDCYRYNEDFETKLIDFQKVTNDIRRLKELNALGFYNKVVHSSNK